MATSERQPDSSMCFVCGRDNPIGLHLTFYVDGHSIRTTFTPGPEHQGWPGIMHGGISSAILDETVGRTAFLVDIWAVTGRLEVRYLQPVPIGRPLTAQAEIVRVRGRILEARGEIRLDDGTLAVEAKGLYVRLSDEKRRELEAQLDLR
jgi:uncharacterized protein (TIGR00369 family)